MGIEKKGVALDDLIDFNYVNEYEKELIKQFIISKKIKKYILGINKFTKSVLKHIEVDGIIDDFTRVQSSRKKEILKIEDIEKENTIILSVSTGSPLEVQNRLNEIGYRNFNYLLFYKYSNFELASPPFIADFEEDYKNNKSQYKLTYDLLSDKKSKEIFTKVINFKVSYDLKFMAGFTNNHEAQYFDKEILPKIKNIVFLDGGGYVGDTAQEVIKNYPDFKKIYLIEPNLLHINIAKRDLGHIKNIEFIQSGLSNKKVQTTIDIKSQNNADHYNRENQNVDTIDNIVNEKVDFIKLDIEGAEQDAIKGAKNTIKKYHPILAICIYHKAEDWYKIPQQILAIEKDYDIYLRHYMEGIFETVLYFIPKKD
jgi:FkbM family methyltransferase